jgi:hypothetical protein
MSPTMMLILAGRIVCVPAQKETASEVQRAIEWLLCDLGITAATEISEFGVQVSFPKVGDKTPPGLPQP